MTNRVSPVVGIQVYCDETRDHRADEVYLLGWPQVRAQRNYALVRVLHGFLQAAVCCSLFVFEQPSLVYTRRMYGLYGNEIWATQSRRAAPSLFTHSALLWFCTGAFACNR